MSPVYWHDFETGRSGFTDGDLPDGPLVEEITAFEFFTRQGHSLICGWPLTHHEKGENVCPCGFIFPQKLDAIWHDADDEALQ